MMPFGHARRKEAKEVRFDFKELLLQGYDLQQNRVTDINTGRPIYPNTLDQELNNIHMFKYRFIIVDVQKCWQNSNALCHVDGYEKGQKWINIGRFESYVHFFQRSTEELMTKAFGKKMGCRTSLFNLESNNFRASIINGNIKIIINTLTKKRYFIFRFWTQRKNTKTNTFEPLFCVCEQNDRYHTQLQQQQQQQQQQQFQQYNYNNNYNNNYQRNCGQRKQKHKSGDYQYWQCKEILTGSEVCNFFGEQCKAISQFATSTISDKLVEEYFLPSKNEIINKVFDEKLPFDYSFKADKCGNCQTRLFKLLNDIRVSLGGNGNGNGNGYTGSQRVKLNRYLKDKLWEIMRYERIDVNYLMQLLYNGINKAKEMAKKYPKVVRTQVYIDDIYGRIHHELVLLVEIIGPSGRVHPLALAMIEDKMKSEGAKNCNCSNNNYNYNNGYNNGYGCNYGNNNYNNNYNNYNGYNNNNWANGYMNNNSNNNSNNNCGNFGGVETEAPEAREEAAGDAHIYRYDGRALLTPRMVSANVSLNDDYLWYHLYVYEHDTTYGGSFVDYMLHIDPNVDLASLWAFDICQKYQHRESFYQVFEKQLEIQNQIQKDLEERKKRSNRANNSNNKNKNNKHNKNNKRNGSSSVSSVKNRNKNKNKNKHKSNITQKNMGRTRMRNNNEAKSIDAILVPIKRKVSDIYKEYELTGTSAKQVALALFEAYEYKSQAEAPVSFSLELGKNNANDADDICGMISYKSGLYVNDEDKIHGFWSLYMALIDKFKDYKNSRIIDVFQNELLEMANQTRQISDLERQISGQLLNQKWQRSKKLVEIPIINSNNYNGTYKHKHHNHNYNYNYNSIGSDDFVKKPIAANRTEQTLTQLQTNQQAVLQGQSNIQYGTYYVGFNNVVPMRHIF